MSRIVFKYDPLVANMKLHLQFVLELIDQESLNILVSQLYNCENKVFKYFIIILFFMLFFLNQIYKFISFETDRFNRSRAKGQIIFLIGQNKSKRFFL